MRRGNIEQMISQIDEDYIKESIDAGRRRGDGNRKRGKRIEKWVAAAAVCVIVLGAGITVTAANSDAFWGWLTGIFGGHEITKVEIEPQKAPVDKTAADVPADGNDHIVLEENMEIYGERESFVCRYHMEEEKMFVDELYSIQGDGLKKLEKKRFQGTYDGVDFSFEYAVINNEIFGCNLTGDIDYVFHYTDGETVYAELSEVEEDVFTKMCIARLNLRTGEVEKLTNDGTFGEMMMSPNGKMILIMHRADGYTTVFDIAGRTEKKIKAINGYTRSSEVVFQDDYHVLTYGEEYFEHGVAMTSTQVVDLRTGKRQAVYKKCGNMGHNPEWVYEQKVDCLTIEHVDGTVRLEIDGVKEFPHPLSYRGDYVLLKNLESVKTPYYLCNLKDKKYMTIVPPSVLKEEVKIYLAAKEGKMLLTDGKDAYLVDISGLDKKQ